MNLLDKLITAIAHCCCFIFVLIGTITTVFLLIYLLLMVIHFMIEAVKRNKLLEMFWSLDTSWTQSYYYAIM